MQAVKAGLGILACLLSASLALWGITLIVRGATDPYDSPAWLFYLAGGGVLCVAALFVAPVLVPLYTPGRSGTAVRRMETEVQRD